jgi:large subunit ribosomal protein L24
MAIHVKKGMTVEIIAGDHKGSTGKIMRVIPDRDRVIIEGHNMVYKHVRPSQQNPQGGRIRVEQPIHISNVLPVGSKGSKGTRVSYKVDEKGGKKRVGSDGSSIDSVTRAKK